MTVPADISASNVRLNRKLSQKDWALLPLISLLTVGGLAVSAELFARRIYYRPPSTNERCLIYKDPSIGVGASPNAVCKTIDTGQLVEYRFNSCGFRTSLSCTQKAPAAFRIVMLGSSTAMGLGVPEKKSFAALLPIELSQLTGRQVELYNEGLVPSHPEIIARWFNQALDPKPDLILWVVTPYDVQVSGEAPEVEPEAQAGAAAKAIFLIKNRPAGQSMLDAMRGVWINYSRTAVLLRHILYKSPSQFLKSYLMSDVVSGYLKEEPTELWQKRLKLFDGYAASISLQAKAAGVPLVVVQLPSRAQVLMVSTGDWPNGYDPYMLNHVLKAIVANHGDTYLDSLRAYRNSYDLDQVFQQADEHPNEAGQDLIAGDLAVQFTSGVIPQLKAVGNARLQTARE